MSMIDDQRSDRGNPLHSWIALAAALLTLGGWLAWGSYQDYHHIDAQQRDRLMAQTEIVEKNVVPQIRLASQVIDRIVGNLPGWQAEKDDFKRANRELRVINDTLLGIRPILVISADGKVLASSNERLTGQNFSHRDYFKTALRDPDPAILHVSAPFKTVLGSFVISLFRSIRGPRGEFAGIVIVSVVPEYFYSLLDSVRYTPDMRAGIVHGDGTVFLTAPRSTLEGEQMARPGTFFSHHLESGRPVSVYAGVLQVTGEERLIASRTIMLANPPMDKPLVIAVGRDLPSIFGAWRNEAMVRGGLFGMLALTTSLGLLIHQRRQSAFNRLMASRDEERKRAEAALRISEERHRLVVEESPLGILVTQGGLVRYANPALTEMIGHPKEDILDRPFLPFIHQEDQAWVKDLHLRRMKGEQVAENYVVKMVRGNGEVRHWQMKTSNFEWDGQPAALGIVSDITERIRLEENLMAARDAAEAVSATKSRFLAAASHDLRQPTQAISLFVDVLARTDLNPEQKRVSDYLAQSAHSLSDLLEVLLDISKLDAGVVRPSMGVISAKELFHKIEADFSAVATGKSLSFRLRFPDCDITMVSDIKLLMSLLGNLIGNAIKYTDRGGVLVSIRRRGGHALVQVWDTGVGIAADDLRSIFDEYFQVGNPERDRTKGLGLGLAIAKRIAALLDTEVRCQSRIGRGSVFEFRLPLATVMSSEMPGSDGQGSRGPGASAKLEGRQIVVVEDNPMVSTALQLSLESLGAKVSRFSDAEAALAAPAILEADFYVSDVQLPGMGGVELLDAISMRSRKPVKAVLITGDTSPDGIGATHTSSWPVLFKPVDLNRLLSAIQSQDPAN